MQLYSSHLVPIFLISIKSIPNIILYLRFSSFQQQLYWVFKSTVIFNITEWGALHGLMSRTTWYEFHQQTSMIIWALMWKYFYRIVLFSSIVIIVQLIDFRSLLLPNWRWSSLLELRWSRLHESRCLQIHGCALRKSPWSVRVRLWTEKRTSRKS